MSASRRVQVGNDFETSGYRISVDEQDSSDFDVSTRDEFDVDFGVLWVSNALLDVKIGGKVDASGSRPGEVQFQR